MISKRFNPHDTVPIAKSMFPNELLPTSYSTPLQQRPQTTRNEKAAEGATPIPLYDQLEFDNICTPRKTFKCPVCDIECPDKGQFRRHYMTHSGEKPYGCNLCPYRCIRKGDVRYHMLRVHGSHIAAASSQ